MVACSIKVYWGIGRALGEIFSGRELGKSDWPTNSACLSASPGAIEYSQINFLRLVETGSDRWGQCLAKE